LPTVYDLQMLVQGARAVARGPVARLVAAGGRNSHEWTAEKASSPAALRRKRHHRRRFWNREDGGFIAGPKNLALALIAFELSWVDAARPRAGLAGIWAWPRFTNAGRRRQRARYVANAAPLKPGENRKQIRAAFALTEPIPFVGVETACWPAKCASAEWPEGGEHDLQVDKRGRFITNMGFANVSPPPSSPTTQAQGQLHGDLEEGDPGTWDRRHADKKARSPASPPTIRSSI